jgi:hypothetical protein
MWAVFAVLFLAVQAEFNVSLPCCRGLLHPCTSDSVVRFGDPARDSVEESGENPSIEQNTNTRSQWPRGPRDCPAWQRRASTCGRALLPHADKHMFVYVLTILQYATKYEIKYLVKHI